MSESRDFAAVDVEHFSHIVKSNWDETENCWYCEIVCTCGDVFLDRSSPGFNSRNNAESAATLLFREHAEDTYS